MTRKEEVLQDVVIKFAGDSGDGMQLTGSQFMNNTALLGIDLATFPDFPAEIRAPQGTLPGVSGFQLRFSGPLPAARNRHPRNQERRLFRLQAAMAGRRSAGSHRNPASAPA